MQSLTGLKLTKKLFSLLLVTFLFSSCAVATLATAIIKITAAIIALPIKAAGADVESMTPDDEDEKIDPED